MLMLNDKRAAKCEICISSKLQLIQTSNSETIMNVSIYDKAHNYLSKSYKFGRNLFQISLEFQANLSKLIHFFAP